MKMCSNRLRLSTRKTKRSTKKTKNALGVSQTAIFTWEIQGDRSVTQGPQKVQSFQVPPHLRAGAGSVEQQHRDVRATLARRIQEKHLNLLKEHSDDETIAGKINRLNKSETILEDLLLATSLVNIIVLISD
jgi:guanylate kinase